MQLLTLYSTSCSAFGRGATIHLHQTNAYAASVYAVYVSCISKDMIVVQACCFLCWWCCLQGASKLCSKARDAGLIVITAGKGDVVRLVPPLVVSDEDIEKCCKILGDVAKEVLV